MLGLNLRLHNILSAFLLSFVAVSTAHAFQDEVKETQGPDAFVTSPGGVNMGSGRFRYSNTDLATGDGHFALERMTRLPREVHHEGLVYNFDDSPMGQFSHNWNIRIRKLKDNAEGFWDDRNIEIGDFRRTYVAGGLTACPAAPSDFVGRDLIGVSACTVDLSGTHDDRIKYYMRRVGLGSIEFDAGIHGSGYCREEDLYCAASKLVRPDGTEFTFEYDVVSNAPRLRRVNSNRGYSLVFFYGYGGGLALRPTSVCLVNRAAFNVGTGFSCPAGAPSTSYSYSVAEHMSSFTDALGNSFSYTTTYSASSHASNRAGYMWVESYFAPGDATPYLENTLKAPLAYEAVMAQSFADGRTINYTWDSTTMYPSGPNPIDYIAGGTYQLVGEPAVTVEFAHLTDWNTFSSFVADGPTKIIDQLGRVTELDQCELSYANPYLPSCIRGGRTQSITSAEGSQVKYKYYGVSTAPIETRLVAKSGSGLTDIVTTAAFDCTKYFLCLSPQYEIDAEGNRTDYTYSTVHGGLLTRTGPAVNGVRPEVRYEYQQRYARVADGTAAGGPIWVLTKEWTCRTTANSSTGCAGGAADQVTTTYDYGPTTGPNNLNVRGVAVMAADESGAVVTERTCYTYDDLGRKVSETTPRAGLGSCS